MNKDTNIAFTTAIDIFSEICMNCGNNDIKNAYRYLYEGIIKVKDSNSLGNVIKMRNSRIKTKISTKINKNNEKVSNAIKSAIDSLSSKLAAKGVPVTTEETIELVDECFNLLEERVNEIKHCDVIINNYNKISKRYNLDKIISEVCYDNDMYQCINEICECIDTYNTPFSHKYNAALETSYSLFNKHFLAYPSLSLMFSVC